MTKRIAVLDLGTNTFHLLITEVSASVIKDIILAEQKHVKLGEGGINKGEISTAAFQRGIDALTNFHRSILKHHVQAVYAVGTAALRTARNGTDFINTVKKQTGIKVEIIEGDKEAALIYMGVKQGVDLKESSLIMDIGGGSVEFIIANSAGIQWKKSYPIGAAKLMATFHHSDPISDKEINAINYYLDDTITDLIVEAQKLQIQKLIGSAGAFETLAALCQIKSNGNSSIIEKSFSFNTSQLLSVISEIIYSVHTEREHNKAILPVRTDMIVVAAVLVKYVIERLNISSIQMTTYALKEGLLVEVINRTAID